MPNVFDYEIVRTGVSTPIPTTAPSATISIDVAATTTPLTWTAGEDETVNLTGTQVVGQTLVLIITNDGTIRTITFGTGFKPAATLVGTASKTAVMSFVSDGTNFYESGRITGIT